MSEQDNKMSLHFWIAALAFSIIMLATTFAILAVYLAEIKSNTTLAITKAEIVADRLNTLDVELEAIHKHIMAQKMEQPVAAASAPPAAATAAPPPVAAPVATATAPATTPAAAPPPSATTVAPAAPAASMPPIQAPSLVAPAPAPAPAQP
jgi:hypothetical protein